MKFLYALIKWYEVWTFSTSSSIPPNASISNQFRHGNLNQLDLPTGTCNAQTPCVNSACCGTNGLCGYSPSECGSGNCTSNCDAKAECGQYGRPGQQNCPLNVCCSKFGFCGETGDFCDAGCQNGFGGCGPPKRPSCSSQGGSVNTRNIGYYEAWSNTRKCQSVAPEDLNVNGYTHVNFAFVFFDPQSFEIAPMDGQTGSLYNRFTALKDKNRGLQTWVSVGGWSFTDPGPTRTAFSDMASSSGNRAKFISGLLNFMKTYGFDGVDLDWEYPQADDRGGVTADTANYVSLVKEMRAAFGTSYGISATLPTSFYYLQHFDLVAMEPFLNFFNLMSYDLHGVWDAVSKFVGPYVAYHTNITEIDAGLDLLWRAGVKPSNVNLGLANYGRSFTLKDPNCNRANGICKFSGGANPGPCSNAAGILDFQEIRDIISSNNLKPDWDKTAGVKSVVWSSNQWISYDDSDTFQQKREFANSRCLGGLMTWAMDQIDQKSDNGQAPIPGVTTDQQEDAQQMADNAAAGITCYTTDCDAKCKSGTNAVAQMNGQPGSLNTNDRCPKNKYRTLCCDDGTLMGVCQWRGYRGVGLSCMGGCADGETEVIQDTNHKEKKGDQTCTGGLQSYCCKGFRPAPNGPDLVHDAKELAKSAAEAAAAQVALDIAAKAFCRIAVPALLAPLELLEDTIPIFGEIADIAEIAATPAIIEGCVKGIEKEGKAEFKVFGKKHTLSMNEPTKTLDKRPPESKHTKPSSSTDCPQTPAETRPKATPLVAPRCEPRMSKKVITTSIVDAPEDQHEFPRKIMECKDTNGQACRHYSSVISRNPSYATVTCPYKRLDGEKARPAVKSFYDQRGGEGWHDLIPGGECQPDEWPPAHFIQTNDAYDKFKDTENLPPRGTDRPQFIRYIDAGENQAAGQQAKGCPAVARSHDVPGNRRIVDGALGKKTEYLSVKAVFTRKVFEMGSIIASYKPDSGLADNRCQPKVDGSDYRGFALLNEDKYFDEEGKEVQKGLRDRYKETYPGLNMRDLEWGVDPDDIVVVGTNSTRMANDQELMENFGIVKCDGDCESKLEEMGIESIATLDSTPPTMPAGTSATTTTYTQTWATETMSKVKPGSGSVGQEDFPRQTSVNNVGGF